MPRWYVCTMDGGVLSEHPTKREAKQAVFGHLEWPIPRRLRPGEYEYNGDNSTHTTTYYVMDERGARRNGWEIGNGAHVARDDSTLGAGETEAEQDVPD